jgi:uncharacterized protein (TIGR02646 family)
MRRIPRQALSAPTLGFLQKRSEAVAKAADPRTEAARLWDLRDNKAFREVRAILQQMASGLERCMYCEDSAGIAIEHFWPRSTYPHRAFDWLNYLIICTLCNSNKRDQFPLDQVGKPLLLDPTEDDPLDHMALSPATGSLLGLSTKGTLTIEIIDLDRETLVKGRAYAWTALEGLIADYAHLRHIGDAGRAARIELTVRNHPFAGVLAALLRIAASSDADLLIEARCLRALRDFPETRAWA